MHAQASQGTLFTLRRREGAQAALSRDRRAVRALCERVEAALESVGGDLVEQLLVAETPALVVLCASLSAAEALDAEESTHEEVLSVVQRMMETLEGYQNKP
jgi:hypothetical protein